MKIIPPLTVTPTELTSTNVAITETEWTAGTYDLGDQRYVGTTLYEVVADPNTDDDPETGVLADPATWIEIGEINRFKMFDFLIGDATEQAGGDIDVTVEDDGLINAVALFEVVGASVQVIVTDDTEGEVYNTTKDLADNSGVSDWYSYFFEPITRDTDAIFLDLPSYIGASVRVIVDDGSNDTAIGELVLGQQVRIGETLQEFSFGIEDFSRKERDSFGRFTIVERRFAKLAEYDIYLRNAQIGPAFRTLSAQRATPTVYVGDDDRPETVIIGFYRDFSTVRTGPTTSEMTLEIEGLV